MICSRKNPRVNFFIGICQVIFWNGVFGVIGLIPEFRQNFALNFCFLVTPLRKKNRGNCVLRHKKGLITPLRQPITPPHSDYRAENFFSSLCVIFDNSNCYLIRLHAFFIRKIFRPHRTPCFFRSRQILGQNVSQMILTKKISSRSKYLSPILVITG